MSRLDRAQRPSSRRAMMLAGVATIAFSLVISIAPAMAANGDNGNGNDNDNGNSNGNSGAAKVHDATTDLEAGEQANEPWVCTFWIGFYADNPTESGTWEVVSWPPTGDGTVVASGTYDTAGDGVDATSEQALPVGHYKLSWRSSGDSSDKHKTFWVDCGEAQGEDQGEDQTPPTDDGQPTGEAAPTDLASPDEQEDPDATDEAAPTPEEGVLAGNPSPVASPAAPEGGAAPADRGSTELPDTSIPVQPSGVLATIGVLLIIAAHLGTRRARSLPTA